MVCTTSRSALPPPRHSSKWKRRLTDAGLAVSGPFDRGWFRSIYFRDPDGQVLEIATRGPGYAVDEPIEALGRRELAPPTSAEIRGARDEAAIAARTWLEPVPVITPDMALEGIHHVSAITGNLDRLNDFYDSALGLKLVKKSFNQDDPNTKHWFWASYDGSGGQAALGAHLLWVAQGWARGKGRGGTERITWPSVPRRRMNSLHGAIT